MLVALIPARAGSKRIPGKNTKLLGGKPLIQWTIEAAQQSGVFSHICIATDDPAVLALEPWDRRTFFHHRESVPDSQPDIVWVRDVLASHDPYDAFAILRPTSPFRTADTIRRAVQTFGPDCSSIRAVERVKQHPGKMWQMVGERRIEPFVGDWWPYPKPLASMMAGQTPWHSMPTQSLPIVYIQNSSLEIAWRWCVDCFGTISGPKIKPFFTEGWEGFSIDYPEDWERAEAHAATLVACVSSVPEVH